MQYKLKLMIGGASVVAVAAGAALTGTTSAYFYDLEKSTGNVAEGCDFDLTYRLSGAGASGGNVNGGNDSFTLENLQPGESRTANVYVRNAGSCAGDAYFDIDNPVDAENGVTEPEAEAGDADAAGDVGEIVQVTARRYSAGGPVYFNGSLNDFAAAPPTLVDGDFGAADGQNLYFTFTVPNGARGAENALMTDSFTFDMDMAMVQDGQVTPGTVGNLG
jgi:hypothetical protein